ncbi:MAG TPA: CxxxxCH/CxxCH domain-containing protein [Polyangiales bacterium]
MTRAQLASIAALLLFASGCHEKRASGAPAVYAELEPLFAQKCLACHGAELAEAGYSVASHYQVIGCVPVEVPATLPAGPDAPLLTVLERDDHATLLNAADQALLVRWVSAGSPKFVGTVHPSGIADPRSDDWHGKLAARDHFAPLRDADASDVCGRCHDGAPVRPADVSFAAPAATACTTCHTEPQGVLACGTCHGNEGVAYPPRDACYFGQHGPDAHAAHLTGTRFRAEPLSCDTCHALPSAEVFVGDHANGQLEVRFVDLPDSSFDPAEHACAVYCHAQQGELTAPHWNQGEAVDCQSCHQSPPPAHYPGECSTCHAEMGSTADSLRPAELHLNGKVDVGNGDGSCGACHGTAPSGAPSDSGHTLHLLSPVTQPLVCADCHPTPASVEAPGHLDGKVQIALGARASARGYQPVWSAAEQRCSSVACHGVGLAGNTLVPTWIDPPSPPEQICQACHASPPPPPHVVRSSCGGSLCHNDEVGLIGSQLRITQPGLPVHIDGFISPPYP